MIFRAHLVPNVYSIVKHPEKKVTYFRNVNPSSISHGKMQNERETNWFWATCCVYYMERKAQWSFRVRSMAGKVRCSRHSRRMKGKDRRREIRRRREREIAMAAPISQTLFSISSSTSSNPTSSPFGYSLLPYSNSSNQPKRSTTAASYSVARLLSHEKSSRTSWDVSSHGHRCCCVRLVMKPPLRKKRPPRSMVIISMASDFYKVLGVPKTASKQDIKGAYRKLARQVSTKLKWKKIIIIKDYNVK